MCNIFSFFWPEEIFQEITHDLWGGVVRKLCKGAACKNDESISQGELSLHHMCLLTLQKGQS